MLTASRMSLSSTRQGLRVTPTSLTASQPRNVRVRVSPRRRSELSRHLPRGERAQIHARSPRQQEEEADWLSGCLLLPREALINIKRRRIAEANAATEYGVSVKMLNYRLAMTGVNWQFV